MKSGPVPSRGMRRSLVDVLPAGYRQASASRTNRVPELPIDTAEASVQSVSSAG
jgi:hypothetical protein